MCSDKQLKTITIVEDFDFTGSIDDIIEQLKTIKDENTPRLSNIKIDDSYWSDSKTDIIGTRFETDEEYSTRLNIELKHNADNEAKERKLLEDLKKKYEK